MEILGTSISELGKKELLQLLEKHLKSQVKKTLFVVTVNPEIAYLAKNNQDYQNTINQADIKTPDGVGIVWAAKFLFKKNLDRITGVDLVHEITNLETEKNIFLLGAEEKIAKKTAENLKEKYPEVKISGTFSTSSDVNFEKFPEDIKSALLKSSVIFVAYGAPKQDLWIKRNIKNFPNCKIIIGVGGAFDIIAEKIKRAPDSIQAIGLEWLYRLVREPWRWKRMLTLPMFVINVIKQKVSQR